VQRRCCNSDRRLLTASDQNSAHGQSDYQRRQATVSFSVSNSSMRLFRFIKRAALLIAVSAVILVTGVSVYLRIEQSRFRRQAERLLSDVRELELEKASAEQVKVVVRKWGFEEWQGPGKPCQRSASRVARIASGRR
jgi:hypothetical protein